MTAGTLETQAPAAPGTRVRGWWPDVIGAAAAFSMLIVVALWIHNQGLQQLANSATTFDSLGRLTGLVSADLLLVQVFLMARVPQIERSFGQDRLARWHRVVGFTSFDLMLAHIVLITLGYAATDHAGVIHEFVDFVLNYPGMLLATAGTVALILIVVTSLRAARRRLRYESWHLLHLYAYLGAGLAIPHELWTGTDFVGNVAATAYWWTVYGIAAGSVLAFRIGLPLWRSRRHGLVVSEVVPETPGVVSVYLSGRNLDRLRVRAGQFFHWRFLSGPGWTRAHPYSLSAAPRPDRLRITVKELGDGSAGARALRPGTRVLIEGPYGQMGAVGRTRQKLTMIASGIGITPLRALLEELPYGPGEATLLYRAHTPDGFTFRDELDELAARRGVRVVYLPGPRASDSSWGPVGDVEDEMLLVRLVPDIVEQDVYVCGPDGWMASAANAARLIGVPEQQLHLEWFSW
ncbi:ferric reductase-like transmembrane domain-containing protein [Rugosimonospora acidiphila]|uniref:Ferric reductase-like transmembrane domain-containing protein n=1 Tax=Rugosimonospora acidiphila TaxID=556531 RepID=A0ABP9RZ33_9ACTN